MTFKKGYIPWNKGKHHTKETRNKISKSLSGEKNYFYGKHLTEEHKKKISKACSGKKHHLYGKHLSEETRKKMSESLKGNTRNKGKHFTEEHKNNLSKALSGEKNPCYGKHLSEETKRKLSESRKGKHFTEEHKNKIRNALMDWDFYNEYGCIKRNYPYNDCFTEEFKDMIRARDGNRCVVTGMTNEEHKVKYGKSLHVHHWTYDKDVTDSFYFVTVTCGINMSAETNRGEWIDLFNGIMEDKYCEMLRCDQK